MRSCSNWRLKQTALSVALRRSCNVHRCRQCGLQLLSSHLSALPSAGGPEQQLEQVPQRASARLEAAARPRTCCRWAAQRLAWLPCPACPPAMPWCGPTHLQPLARFSQADSVRHPQEGVLSTWRLIASHPIQGPELPYAALARGLTRVSSQHSAAACLPLFTASPGGSNAAGLTLRLWYSSLDIRLRLSRFWHHRVNAFRF